MRPLTMVETKDGQGYPEIDLRAGTETLATVHHLGNDREAEWKALARALAYAEPTLAALEAAERALTACADWLRQHGQHRADTANHWAAEARQAIDKARGQA